MWSLSELLLLLLGCVFIIKYLKVIWAARILPPGPTPFPFIGNLWTLNFKLHPETLRQLNKLYGNIYTVWLGETPLVVLNGCKAVKDAIVSHSEELSGRPVASFLKDLLGGKGESFDPSATITHSVANVISAVVFGHRFSIDDDIFQNLVKCNLGLIESIGSTWGRITSERNSTFDEENLITLITDLFTAGTETTATSLQWALLYMVAYPHIQQKVHKELDAVFNGSQLFFYEDRKRLPYTNAVIHEIQRYGNIAAVGLARTCIKDVKVSGYSLHKNTMVLPNLDSVLHDAEYWKTPNQFNPHHFLNNDGNFLVNEAFLPFSAGHRVCVGEQLARYELFIFFTTLMRSFSFHLPEGVTEVNTKYVFHLTLQPHPYKICANPR